MTWQGGYMDITVQVLLSSYNGEKYLREQIDSILAQQGVKVSLLVRDDGSTDGTREILEGYRESHENIALLYGENIGAARSFFALIDAADQEAEYTAFADQDDVWLPDKLERAVKKLREEGAAKAGQNGTGMGSIRNGGREGRAKVPLAYCSATYLVDEKLRLLKSAIRYPEVRTEFGNALVENMCIGCTCVVNGELLALIKGRTPRFAVMHDFWVYLVGTCFGEVVYDTESRILYRQHGDNELGAASSRFGSLKKRLKYHKKHLGQFSRQAAEFFRIYGDSMPKDKRRLAGMFVKAKTDRKARGKMLKEGKLFRQRKSDGWIFRVLFAAGKL